MQTFTAVTPAPIASWALALGALVLGGCGSNAFVGRVVDEQGAPVVKAEVSTEPVTDIVLTNAAGVFSLRQVVDPTGAVQPIGDGGYTITVRKLGFLPLTIPVKAEGGAVQLGDHTLSTKTITIVDTPPAPIEPTIDHTKPDPPVSNQ